MPEREMIFNPPFELMRELNLENPQGPIWTWTLRYDAGSPLGHIVIEEIITVDVLTSSLALEMILQKIMARKEL